jgi:hypothetical protein
MIPSFAASRTPFRRQARSVAAAVALSFALPASIVTAVAPAVAADTARSTPQASARLANEWLAGRVNAQGFVPTPADTPNVGATLDVALSFAAAGSNKDTFDRIVGWLRANTAVAVAPDGPTSPGNVGQLLLVVAAAGENPTSFGGLNLFTTLENTLDDFETGLYGETDPSFDGAFRQSLAILGLAANGAAVPSRALVWLADQQCGGGTTPAAASGGWQAYRADLGIECAAPDLNAFSGPDTNATAFAAQALTATNVTPTYDIATFLATARESDGGFGFLPGGGSDPNSTALVVQALRALGQDPAAAPWTDSSGGPLTSLASWQLGCDTVGADRGALASPYSDGAPDEFATRQAPWGFTARAFPLGAIVWSDAGDPCADPTNPTTPSDPGTSPTTPTTRPGTIAAVTTNPRLAG